MADYIATEAGLVRIDLGIPSDEPDPPTWLEAYKHGRGPVRQGRAYDWLPKNATAQVYGEIAAYAYIHEGAWWDALYHLASGARRAAEQGCLYGYPRDWLVTPTKRVPGTCSCCGKVDGHFESGYAGRPAITCEKCGELTFVKQ